MPQSASHAGHDDASDAPAPPHPHPHPHPQIAAYLDALKFERQLSPHTLESYGRELAVLQRLVDQGNTVVLIEHNLDVIKTADHVIDLGPEGGEDGGLVVATGTPAALSRHSTSHTGKALAGAPRAFAGKRGQPARSPRRERH